MEEKQLEIIFREFLLQIGYPPESLLSQVVLRTRGEGVFRPDLMILDIRNNEYIGLIEFKSRFDVRTELNTLGQFYKYFSLVGQAIPAYLVFPISEDDFQILALTKQNDFEPISKEDFPAFETLSAKRLTEEKMKQREVEEKTLLEFEKKKRKARQSAYLSILSLLLGVTASITAVFFQQKDFYRPEGTSILCCDSIQTRYTELERKILNLERKINTSPDNKSITDTIYINSNTKGLDKRLKIIEKGISDNPERTLSFLQIKQEIDLLKKTDDFSQQIMQAKLDSLNDKMEIQNAWMLGVLIAIFGTILSIVVPNLLTRRSE